MGRRTKPYHSVTSDTQLKTEWAGQTSWVESRFYSKVLILQHRQHPRTKQAPCSLPRALPGEGTLAPTLPEGGGLGPSSTPPAISGCVTLPRGAIIPAVLYFLDRLSSETTNGPVNHVAGDNPFGFHSIWGQLMAATGLSIRLRSPTLPVFHNAWSQQQPHNKVSPSLLCFPDLSRSVSQGWADVVMVASVRVVLSDRLRLGLFYRYVCDWGTSSLTEKY